MFRKKLGTARFSPPFNELRESPFGTSLIASSLAPGVEYLLPLNVEQLIAPFADSPWGIRLGFDAPV